MSTHIIVGIDGSEHSLHAYRWALAESARREAELSAIFAWETPMIGLPAAFDRTELENDAKRFLNEQLDRAGSTDGVTVHRVIAHGDPSASLIEACRQSGAELLVIGSRGRGGFSGLLLGSVGQECASHAPCPVVICRAQPTPAR